ncbi:MAG: Maf family protein, partial [Sedimenticola sp.]|nr:Maf family protein [Sedimenticola sp.]MCW8883015.1 Maf family protein [Sedimenticola sp.]MCW8946034.1 Maf family protein [Sedimenticola sp.]
MNTPEATKKIVNTTKIILGSTSPFRRQLLEKLRLQFDVDSPDIDESHQPEETPEQ